MKRILTYISDAVLNFANSVWHNLLHRTILVDQGAPVGSVTIDEDGLCALMTTPEGLVDINSTQNVAGKTLDVLRHGTDTTVEEIGALSVSHLVSITIDGVTYKMLGIPVVPEVGGSDAS
ncbi:MAG: hypothetical protein HGB04_04035 [Chlorobiaceae bacterium]|nr:hypothetical protein [Chlorobiaceae bacterium]